MSISNYGRFDAVTIGGLSTLNAYPNKVYWLDSNGGGGSRGTWSHPFKTLDDALGHCDADKGDTILVKPKHAETVTGAGGITLDVDGVSIIGLGRYNSMPRFLMDGDAITGLVTGADVMIQNCEFAAGHEDIAVAFLVSGVGCTIDSCRFTQNVATENFVAVLNAGVAHNDYDGLTFSNNVLDFTTAETAVLAPVNCLKNSKDIRIIGNKILGDFDTTPFACIYSVNTLHHMNCEIAYNLIHNQHDADAVVGISFGSTTSTGWMHHNLCAAFDIAAATPFLAAAGGIVCFENYYTGDASTSGFIMPAIGTDA